MFFPSELGSKDLNDYKNSKAYSYYKSGWLQPLYYHAINMNSKFCIIRTECRKSQNIRDSYHKLWIVVEKKTAIINPHVLCCVLGHWRGI